MVITTRCCPVVFFLSLSLSPSLSPSLSLSLSRFASRLTIRLVYGDQSRMNGGDQPKTKVAGNIIWAWEDSSAFLLGGAGSLTAVARGRAATCQTKHPRRRPRVMEGRRRLVNKWVSGSHSQAIRLIDDLEKRAWTQTNCESAILGCWGMSQQQESSHIFNGHDFATCPVGISWGIYSPKNPLSMPIYFFLTTLRKLDALARQPLPPKRDKTNRLVMLARLLG